MYNFSPISNVIFATFRLDELLRRSMSTTNNVNRTEPMPTTGEPNKNYASKPFRGDEFFSNWTILLSRAELFCSIPTLPFLFDSPGKQSKQQKEFLTVKSKQEELQQYFYNIKIKTPSSDVFGNPTNWSSTLGQLPWGCQGLGERA